MGELPYTPKQDAWSKPIDSYHHHQPHHGHHCVIVVVFTIWWQQSEVDPSCLEALPQRATSLISVFYGLNIRPYLAPGPLGANFRQR